MRRPGLAIPAVTALRVPAFAEDEAPAAPAVVRSAPVPRDAVPGYDLIGPGLADGTDGDVVEKGRLAGRIVPAGGFLGVGVRYVVIGPSPVDLAPDVAYGKGKNSLNAGKDAPKAAPEFRCDDGFKR